MNILKIISVRHELRTSPNVPRTKIMRYLFR